MTCGVGTRTRVRHGPDCMQTLTSAEECSAASCMVNEHLSVCFMDGKLTCDVFRQCNTFS